MKDVIERLTKLSKVGFGYDITFEDREALKDAVKALSASPAGVVKDEAIAAIISDDDAPDAENIVLAQQGIAAGFDNHSVNQFAFAMRAKLAEKREEGRGGWHDKDYCSVYYLSRLLREHVEKGDPVDVANFCMMLHQRGERIMSAIEPAGVGVETAKAEAFDKIVAARRKHVDAVAAYNARRELATAERMRGSWAIKLDDEYRVMHDAQSELFAVMQSVCDAALKGDEQ